MMPIRESKTGGSSLLVVETRQSRLDIYRFAPQSSPMDFSKIENPNYLPMAEDFEKKEIPLSRLPQVASVYDVDKDGVDEIFIVQSDPRKLIVLKRAKHLEDWEPIKEWEVAESPLSTHQPILVREGAKGLQVLISFGHGIQLIDYDLEGEVEWLQPRERDIERNRWWLADLDQDGDSDIVEARNTVTAPIRWYEAEGDSFRPAVSISEEVTNTNVARIIHSMSGPRIAFLGANQANTISVFELGEGVPSEYGKRNLLPVSQPDAGGWASLTLDGRTSVVELGRSKPVLNVYALDEGFWKFQSDYPILKDTIKVRSVGDPQRTLLFQVDGEGQIYHSRWDGARFTFPKRLGKEGIATGDSKLLAFDQFGEDTWWASQRDDLLSLSIWSSGADSPRTIEFAGIDGDLESCVWLGGDRLLARKRFSKGTVILSLSETGELQRGSSRFEGSDIGRISLHQGTLYLQQEGVVQILGNDLEVVDQIMLEGDYSVQSFAPVSDSEIFALESDGEHLHRLLMGESGIFETESREEVPYALEVSIDPVLGLTLTNSNSINLPGEGASQQLVQKFMVDPNEGASRDFQRKVLGTLFSVDIDGDGYGEIATVDYSSRDIFVYQQTGDGDYAEAISWKVFDDGKYPYGQDSGGQNSINPYRMLATDMDGDGFQDLVMASHDRILIYLAKDSKL